MDIHDQKLWLLGIMLECPMGKSLNKCPANKFRGCAVSEILNIVDSLPDESIHLLIEQHKQCLETREKSVMH